MVLMKLFVPALALAGLASAASGDCDGKVIQNQGDADGLASCRTITGDLEVSERASGTISISGVQRVNGKFTCKGAVNLTELSASSLSRIGDAFLLSGLTTLASLRFDALTEVDSINFEALPRLQQLSFSKGVSKASRLRIANTDLVNLGGINLNTVGDMEISNNPHLTEVNVNQITNTTGFVSFSANNMKLKVTFPNLENALNMTFRNVSAISLPSLKKTTGLLGLYSNYIEDFSAPNLTSTGDLVLAANSQLSNLSLPLLEDVRGAFQVANNTNLKSITDVPKLKKLNGALDLSGNFTEIRLPSVDEVRGQVNIQSSDDKFSCSTFEKDLKPNTRGKFTCLSNVKDPQSTDPNNNGKPKPSSGIAMSDNVLSRGGVTMIALLTAIVGMAF
ncbi:cell wall protein Ecm33 [Ophidiomyces ophidiicola]|uniref:Cell wall protein Ecm33 n=1 Tax=Ophidiomyces ophidiicola TaxID=1387563 RepID=A0ACB8UM93_9EURO|nr:cell wall protein Ecm33 [Ophidiomyces ophidiicola]KAI1907899.1 cell wall protein Ecm33 [Ophidiomyces ophidiicola]KAI1909187.1 cell wall protein Ecm33 [Ophidiomyces ophidiicola]KAI1923192.1 cell wall protein Ecm33 [Ophidiomyces ophidiicola]KAI1940866.1 cell wall protein Ecm33 [Ophidiomyces ophidiicola]KAI1944787.1 cell wall protein Ecm33 [Ophidiomyces ophidiicola]